MRLDGARLALLSLLLTAMACGDGGGGAVDATTGGDAASGPDGRAADAATADATAPDAPAPDAPAPDASLPDAAQPDAASVAGWTACYTLSCPPGEGCCEPPGGGSGACAPVDDPCTGLLITCDGREDCGGEVCCQGVTAVTCGDTAMCPGGNEACATDEDCPILESCCPPPTGPGGEPRHPFGTCQPACAF